MDADPVGFVAPSVRSRILASLRGRYVLWGVLGLVEREGLGFCWGPFFRGSGFRRFWGYCRVIPGQERELRGLVGACTRVAVERADGGMRELRAGELRRLLDGVVAQAERRGLISSAFRRRAEVRKFSRTPKPSAKPPPGPPKPPRLPLGKPNAGKRGKRVVAPPLAPRGSGRRGGRGGGGGGEGRGGGWGGKLSISMVRTAGMDEAALQRLASRVDAESPRDFALQHPANRKRVSMRDSRLVNGEPDEQAGVLATLDAEAGQDLMRFPGMVSRLSAVKIDPFKAQVPYDVLEAYTEFKRDKDEAHVQDLIAASKARAKRLLAAQFSLKDSSEAREAREEIAEAMRMDKDVRRLKAEEAERKRKDKEARRAYAKDLTALIHTRDKARRAGNIMTPGETAMNRDQLTTVATNPKAALHVLRSRSMTPETLCKHLGIDRLPQEVYDALEKAPTPSHSHSSAPHSSAPRSSSRSVGTGTLYLTKRIPNPRVDVLGHNPGVAAEPGVDGVLSITAAGPFAPPLPSHALRRAALKKDPGLWKLEARKARERKIAAYQRKRADEMMRGVGGRKRTAKRRTTGWTRA